MLTRFRLHCIYTFPIYLAVNEISKKMLFVTGRAVPKPHRDQDQVAGRAEASPGG